MKNDSQNGLTIIELCVVVSIMCMFLFFTGCSKKSYTDPWVLTYSGVLKTVDFNNLPSSLFSRKIAGVTVSFEDGNCLYISSYQTASKFKIGSQTYIYQHKEMYIGQYLFITNIKRTAEDD